MITPRMFGERGRRRALKLGIDPERLPPGQSPTLKFPEFTFRSVPEVDLDGWALAVHGKVEEPFALRWEEFRALEHRERTCDLHCVTRWSKFDTRWEGVPVAALLDRARPLPAASHVLLHCFDGYTTNLPLEVARLGMVAHTFEGEPLEPHHGGPARMLVPERYLWKSAKWLRAIEVLDRDRPGFWERNGYHNEGDPWKEQRHG